MTTKTTGTISFSTPTALALWNDEILGQLSDGMWENTAPLDHYKFWHCLTPVLGTENKVTNVQYAGGIYCRKNSYRLTALREYVEDRMLKTGRMAKAIPLFLGTEEQNEWLAASADMPSTFDEWKQCKETGTWKYPFLKDRMDSMPEDVARRYYESSTYTVKELLADLKRIKEALKSVDR